MSYSATVFAFVVHWNASPEIFEWNGFAPRWYSLAFLLGFMAGYYILQRMFRAEKVATDSLDTLLLLLIAGTVIGARLGHCIFYDWDYFKDHLAEILLPFQFQPEFQFTGYRGLSSHGGLIGVLTAQWVYCRYYLKKPLIWLLDRIGVPVMLVACLIRLGNLMNSEIIGAPTEVPWAFVFEQVDSLPRHPVQLYESIAYFLIFILLYFLYWRTAFRKKPGRLVGIFTVLLWSVRFVLEYFKREQGGLENVFGLFTTGQWLSIPLIILGLYFWLRDRFASR